MAVGDGQGKEEKDSRLTGQATVLVEVMKANAGLGIIREHLAEHGLPRV